MVISRFCPMCGQKTERELDITSSQISAYQNGTLIQDAFPNLDADDREFIKTGYCQKCIEVLFAPVEDEE